MVVVDMEPFGEPVPVWMLAVLLRLDPKPRFLKRELMTDGKESMLKKKVGRSVQHNQVVNASEN